MIQFVSQLIYDKKGFNIFAIDIRGVSSVTDYMLIAEGNCGSPYRIYRERDPIRAEEKR